MKRKARGYISRTDRNGERYYIREFRNASGTTSFRVCGVDPGGKQVRLNFKTEAEAVARKGTLEAEAQGMVVAAQPKSTRLSDEELQAAEAAFAALRQHPAKPPLSLVVSHFLKTWTEPVKPMLLPDAMDAFLKDKAAKGKRPDTIRNLRSRVGQLVEGRETRHVHEILREDVESMIFAKGVSPRTQINNRLAISAFFTWCQRQRYCANNPVREVERPEVDDVEPQILSVSDVRRLLVAARDFKEGKLLPYMVLATFAAIRPTELSRLDWRQIDLKHATVTITGSAAKLRARRVVELSENAVEWLRPFALSRPAIRPSNFRNDWDEVRRRAGFGNQEETPGLKPWVEDYLRHTGITMHLRHNGHEGTTASWAGNSVDVVHKHYRGLVSAEDAKSFWSITPKDGEVAKLAESAA